MVSGTVYHDSNANQKLDLDDKPLPDVLVSNGVDIVRTNAQGKYTLLLESKHDAVFLIKPAGYQSPLNEYFIPKFFYINRPTGSPVNLKYPGHKPTNLIGKTLDFPLNKQNESLSYTVLLFGDTQVPNYKSITWMRHDAIEPLIGTTATFGITLGDVVHDNLVTFDQYKTSIAQLEIPWYNVLGNHDINFDVPDDKRSIETWLTHFGPPNYAFNYANTHYIVIDNVNYHGKKEYGCDLSIDQLTFIKNDLKNVSKDTLVVVLMHIPLYHLKEEKRRALFDLIKDFPYTFSASSHRHYQQHEFYNSSNGWGSAASPEHHHLIAATICGAWWGGVRDEFGIPTASQRDGSPNAYNILSIKDNAYSLRLHNLRRPKSDQMSIYLADSIPVDKLADQTAYINIYAGSEKSITMARIRHQTDWLSTQPVTRIDPYHLDRIQRYKSNHFPNDKAISIASKTPHHAAFKLPTNLKSGTYLLQVKTTDLFGQTDTASRIFNVTSPGSALVEPTTR
ncbi:calcineurin-like phosphoesterase C-terminal domain-containing protein [Poriferisphaera sp. WC338]|uniref:calcineurin-like phosphoesterase C-terminal domain-containing protein n=1 Tax=Poriferisphaera sp. WC338 TaxID=3425129 RepID=UPI003D816D87